MTILFWIVIVIFIIVMDTKDILSSYTLKTLELLKIRVHLTSQVITYCNTSMSLISLYASKAEKEKAVSLVKFVDGKMEEIGKSIKDVVASQQKFTDDTDMSRANIITCISRMNEILTSLIILYKEIKVVAEECNHPSVIDFEK